MQAEMVQGGLFDVRKPVWPAVVVSGLLRGLLGTIVFFNLISQLAFGSVAFFMGVLGGLVGNLAFLGVVGLICSLVTQSGGQAYRIYARSFLVAVVLYLIALPVLIYFMPQIPAGASLSELTGTRAAMTAMRTSVAMETYRYTQLLIFSVQMVFTYFGLARSVSAVRAGAAVLICLAIYLGLFIARII
ncbi:hypothetical protein [Deinococcus aquiradiocola]|uniref:Yip1 domain-containing protein n=1 Tax=Deinococcus aquiradiocola TaxID=393059 RepID=A0A917PQB5_9DEIO|nr:hypothetical protein [Deinococcus aquiradiocola]GGJ87010.1 hypothetical protein GCM10008939_33790 [Deinococcus aquiradiocola]